MSLTPSFVRFATHITPDVLRLIVRRYAFFRWSRYAKLMLFHEILSPSRQDITRQFVTYPPRRDFILMASTITPPPLRAMLLQDGDDAYALPCCFAAICLRRVYCRAAMRYSALPLRDRYDKVKVCVKCGNP